MVVDDGRYPRAAAGAAQARREAGAAQARREPPTAGRQHRRHREDAEAVQEPAHGRHVREAHERGGRRRAVGGRAFQHSR
eukprot:8065135-Pyramimonas_sp.AAC.1